MISKLDSYVIKGYDLAINFIKNFFNFLIMSSFKINLSGFIQLVSDKRIRPNFGTGINKQITFTNLRKARIIFPEIKEYSIEIEFVSVD